jgi:glycosyltransferase involved in cell wall biosynthesis
VLTSKEGWLSSVCAELGVPCIVEAFPSSRSLGARLLGNRRFAGQVGRQLKQRLLDPVLVHGNDHLEGLVGLALMHHLAVPGVVTLRSPGMTRRDFEKYRCASFQAVTAVGQDIRARAAEYGKSHVHLVFDGLAENEFLPLKGTADHPPQRVLIVGSPVIWKGWRDFTDALALVEGAGRQGPISFDFTGGEPCRELNDLGLERFAKGRARFLGWTTDFRGLVREYDLVINPSRQETFGMAAVETIAAGVPLLTTEVGVLGEIVEERRMLVPPSDPQALANALIDIYDGWSTLRERDFGVPPGQSKLRQAFHIDQTVRGYQAVYEGLLADHR